LKNQFLFLPQSLILDIKQQEAGICQLAEWLEIPFETYSAAELLTREFPAIQLIGRFQLLVA
jgi:hypothetical protein